MFSFSSRVLCSVTVINRYTRATVHATEIENQTPQGNPMHEEQEEEEREEEIRLCLCPCISFLDY